MFVVTSVSAEFAVPLIVQEDTAVREISQLPTDDIIARTRLIENECKVRRSIVYPVFFAVPFIFLF